MFDENDLAFNQEVIDFIEEVEKAAYNIGREEVEESHRYDGLEADERANM